MEIYGTVGGAVEECGNTSLPTDIQSWNFTVIFRTSDDDITGYGFEMHVICYKPAEAELEGIRYNLENFLPVLSKHSYCQHIP